MSRNLTEDDAKAIGKYMADEFFTLLQDEEKMDLVAAAWTKSLDRRVGATIRRSVWAFLMGIGVVVALKFESFMASLKNM